MDKKDIEFAINIANVALKAKLGRELKDRQKDLLRGTLEGLTYEKMADKYFRSPTYFARDIGPKFWKLLSEALGEAVSKTNFKAALDRYYQAHPELFASDDHKTVSDRKTWLGLPDRDIFYGRAEEIATLEQWIVTEQCRLVAIVGMGGMGKSSIALQTTHQIGQGFDYVIWRSLRDAPPLSEILTELVSILSNQVEARLPDVPEQQVAKLLEYVRQSKCLLIFDNFESVFQSGTRAGQYRDGYEIYGHLLSRFSEVDHQSCLVLTSREAPKEITGIGESKRVRSLSLCGLSRSEGLPILTDSQCFSSSDAEWQEIFNYCSGSPFALKILASETQELFAGDISSFLALAPKSGFQIERIQDLLEKQFSRLSVPEQCVMYWLAIEREPVVIAQLESNIVSESIKKQLLTAVQSLKRRSLIEGNSGLWSLQPVMMEFVTDKFVQKVVRELISLQPDFLEHYALIKAQSKDYVRQAQVRSILEAISDRLLLELGDKSIIETRIQDLLAKQRKAAPTQRGYLAGNLINLLSHLNFDLDGYDFSYLHIRQAYLQSVNLQNTNFTSANFEEVVFTQAFGMVLSVVYHPEGSILATGNVNCEIYLWRITDGQQIGKLCGHTNWVRGLVFSPDGSLLASGSDDGTVRLWDWQNSNCLYVLGDNLRSMCFSPNGQLLVTTSEQEIQIRRLEDGCQLYTLQGHENWVMGACFHPDGKLLASGSSDCTIRLWDLEKRECVQVLRGHKSWVIPATFSPDGSLVLSSSFDRTIRLWHSQDGECLTTLHGHEGWIWIAIFSPDGKWVASCSEDRTIKIWDYANEKCICTIAEHQHRIWSISISPDSQTVASASEDQTVKLWDINSGKCVQTILGYANPIFAAMFSPDGTTVATGHIDGYVRIWNAQTSKCLHKLFHEQRGVTATTFHPKQALLASGGQDGTIRIWQLDTLQCIHLLKGHSDRVNALAYSNDAQIIASSSFDHTIKIWKAETGELVNTFQDHTDRIGAIAFHPQQSLLVSVSEDKTAKIWDIKLGKCIQTLTGHTNRITSVAIHPHSGNIATGGLDNLIIIWDETGKQIHQLSGHTGWVLSLAFSPDGKWLASCGCDRMIKLWYTESWLCYKTIQGHENWVLQVRFSPDSQFLVSASEDETVKVWNIAQETCNLTLRVPRAYEGMRLTGATGITSAQRDMLRSLGAL
ncbi:NB-ARC domain-containing protein [Pseudanabaena sp. ABRG5-3]|uniref:WD40 domain-containing protein n=1 Tax=Pseudanabaena sp. ABRG5-3 TaxID=685565 RepID=UPI000DC71C48|nr:NB-ARC domain-containing protein [Pseudanabaena sp. ABRG5-3]BBC26062.1 WD-40 repeat protein [Pseudanabaena sp. ABRG5-3]